MPPLRRFRSPAASAAALIALTACSGSMPGAGPAPADDAAPVSRDAEPVPSELALATFDSAWSRINTSYYDPDFRGLDWSGIRDELRPEASGVETLGELRNVLRDMLSRLGESHFAILPQEGVDGLAVDDSGVSEDSDVGDLGLELRWVEGELTVFRVDPGPAADAGVGTGWIVDGIGDRDLTPWRELVANAESDGARKSLVMETISATDALMRGAAGSTVTLRFRDGEGERRTLSLERKPVRGQMVRFGDLPAMPAFLEFERRPAGDSCVGVIRFNVWMVPLVADFNRAVDALADCHGMVLDLRGNIGGVGGMVMSTAGSFFAERADLGVVQSRAGEIRFVAMPRGVDTEGRIREAFTGPLAVLIDEQSMSTSEIFAAGLKATGRARLFGTATPGYALPAMTLRLPSQDVLYHVIANLTGPDGMRIEGEGVVPHQPVPLRRDELLAGRDAPLEAALAWAAGPGTPASSR